MSQVQQLRPLFAQPAGLLRVAKKAGKFDWFDGREIRVATVGREANEARTVLLSVSGPSGEYHLPLSAGEAAHLMFEIGYALEQAAKARSN